MKGEGENPETWARSRALRKPDPHRKPCRVSLSAMAFCWCLWGRWVGGQAELARDAVDNLERLGPTFTKLGQIMSIRWGLQEFRV